MSYRAPAVCFTHVLRKAGPTAITIGTGTEAAGFPKTRLLDNRGTSLFKFAAPGTGMSVEVDRGAGTLEPIDRMFIPAGHNFAGISLQVEHATTPGGWVTIGIHTPTAGLIDFSFTATTNRYLRLWIFNGSTAWELGELVFTRTRSPARGPEPRWTVDTIPNQVQTRMRSGEVYGLVIGPEATIYRLRLFGVSAADKAIFDELWTEVGAHTPFYFVPPDTTDPVIYARMRTGLVREQDHPNPGGAAGPSYVYTLELEEALG